MAAPTTHDKNDVNSSDEEMKDDKTMIINRNFSPPQRLGGSAPPQTSHQLRSQHHPPPPHKRRAAKRKKQEYKVNEVFINESPIFDYRTKNDKLFDLIETESVTSCESRNYTWKDEKTGQHRTTSHRPVVFTWKDICVTSKSNSTPHISLIKRGILSLKKKGDVIVDDSERSMHGVESSKKKIVDNVSGLVKPGEMLAIMGASGAGKTSLLNALTFRNLKGLNVSGERFANGVALTPSSLTSLSSYIQQYEMFIGTLTVRETLKFQALVRMEKHISVASRMLIVESVLQEMGLTKCADTLVGYAGRLKGISGGEMKRLSFACEMLTNPTLMFADEPTSGLDSFLAQNVVKIMKNLSRQGKSIICTIHQPSSQVYEYFDKILFMAEGRVAFLGGRDHAKRFFESVQFPCPKNYNPADYFIHTLAVHPGHEYEARSRNKQICDEYSKSSYGKLIDEEVKSEVERGVNDEGDMTPKGMWWMDYERKNSFLVDLNRSPYKASWCQQFRALLWRSWLSVLKEPLIFKIRIIQTILIALLLGTIFFQQKYDNYGISNLNGVVFLFLINLSFQTSFAVVAVFTSETQIMYREHKNGMYRIDVYFLAKQIAETPIFIIAPTLFCIIFYWMIGMNPDPVRFLIFLGINQLMTFTIVGFSYLLSAAASDTELAFSLCPPLIVPMLLFGGYYLHKSAIPFWLNWVQYLSWFRYAFEGMMINQWLNTTTEVSCEGSDLTSVAQNQTSPIPSQTTTSLSTCRFQNGNDVLTYLGFDGGLNGLIFNVVMLSVLTITFRLVAYLLLVFRAKT